jgi:sulfur carrier protein
VGSAGRDEPAAAPSGFLILRRGVEAMQATVNGELRELPEGITILELIEQLQVRRDAVAVEVNRQIVPRARHREQRLREGDAVEFVTFVGGG